MGQGCRPERGRLFLRLRNSEVEFQGQASKPGRVESRTSSTGGANVQVFAKLLSFVGPGPGSGAVRVRGGWGPPPDNHWAGAQALLPSGNLAKVLQSSDAASAAACFPLCQRGCIKTAIISSVSNNTNEHSYKNWLHKVNRQLWAS